MKHAPAVRLLACALLLFLTVPLLLLPVCGETADEPDLAEAQGVYLYHLESASVILSKNEQQTLPAGSTVKVLSGLVLCELLANRLDEAVLLTSDMLRGVQGYHYGLRAGEIYTVEELLYLAVCASYNDAYQALAVLSCDTSEDFLLKMREKAVALGAQNAYFSDVCGVDDGSGISIHELSLIAMEAAQNTLFMKISSTQAYNCQDHRIYNRNALISAKTTASYYNSKCRGMSAGSTDRAGNCVVTLAEQDGERYLCIVLGGKETEETQFGYRIANRIIDWVYDTYTYMNIITPDTVLCSIPVEASDLTSELEVRTDQTVLWRLPAGSEIGKDITYSIRLLSPSLEAPVTEGTFVGYASIIYKGEILTTVRLYTVGAAERSALINSFLSIQRLTQNRAFLAGSLFFAISLVTCLTVEYVLAKRRKNRWNKYFSKKTEFSSDLFKNPK